MIVRLTRDGGEREAMSLPYKNQNRTLGPWEESRVRRRGEFLLRKNKCRVVALFEKTRYSFLLGANKMGNKSNAPSPARPMPMPGLGRRVI